MAKRIIVAVIFVPLLMAVILFLPPFWWALVVAFISGMAAFELLRATGEGKITVPMRVVTLLSAVLIPLGNWAGLGVPVACVCLFVVTAVSFWCAIRAYDEGDVSLGFYHVLLTLFAGAAIPLGLSALVQLRGMVQGRYLVLLAVLLSFITDGAAYFGGVFLGKHRGVTRVSPKKSVEGYFCGFAGGVLFAVLYGLVIGAIEGCDVSLVPLGLCGLLGALVTELGDLVFSFIKRQFGVKDYGHLLPGHGGMLDRFDSMIFCGPVILFIVTYFPVF
ncbi:MAG: phosphatidate cytidylyltransferase [Oscillospiraceae bacterium]